MAKNSTVNITIVTGDPSAAVIARHLEKAYDNPTMGIEDLIALLHKVQTGIEPGKVFVFQDGCDGTAATGTLACTQANFTAGETCTIAGVVFTAATSPSTDPAAGEFAAGASDTAMGANLTAAINAHPALKGLCTATNAAGTVTVTAVDKGIQGNLIKLSKTGDCIVATSPTNGAIGTVQTPFKVYRRGL